MGDATEPWLFKKVLVHNTDDSALNGRVGGVVRGDGGKLVVQFDALEGGTVQAEECSVHQSNVVEAGVPLRVHGLEKAVHLNGKEAYRLGTAADKNGRIAVVVKGTGQSALVKPENVQCGRRGAGSLLFWGDMGAERKALPSKVNAMKGHRIVDISCGMMHIAVVTGAGNVFCWGNNDAHQCCTSDEKVIVTPKQVALCEPVNAVACGAAHTIVVSDSGFLYAWGANAQGSLGQGDTCARQGVVRIHLASRLRAVACGLGHVVALDTDGVLWGWGWNHAGQLGTGGRENVVVPTQVKENVNIASCGGGHTVAVDRDGRVWGTGSNACGQLGLGHDENQLQWCAVGGVDAASLVNCGEEFTVIVKETHAMVACGIGIVGQLGDGRGEDTFSASCPHFVDVKLTAPVELIASSQKEVIAIDRNGQAWGWGAGNATPQVCEPISKRKVLQLVCGRKFYCAVLDGAHPAKCIVEGVRDRAAGERVVYTIISYTSTGTRCSSGGEEVIVSCAEEVDDNFDGTYSAATKVTKAGMHCCRVTLFGEDVEGSPFPYCVAPGPPSLPHSSMEIWCPAQRPDGAIPAGASVFLTLSLRDKFGNDVSAAAADFEAAVPEDAATPVRGSDETLTLAWSWTKTGTHRVPVLYKDDMMGSLDFVVVGGDPVKVLATGEGLSAATVGRPAYVTLTATDKHGNATSPASMHIGVALRHEGSGKTLLAALLSSQDAEERWTYTPVAAGEHLLTFLDGDGKEAVEACTVQVAPDPDAPNDAVNGLEGDEAGQRQRIERAERVAWRKLLKAMKVELKEARDVEKKKARERRAKLTQERAAAAAKAARAQVKEEAEEAQRTKTRSKRCGGGFVVKYAWD